MNALSRPKTLNKANRTQILLKVDRLAEGIKIASLDSAVHIIDWVVELNQKSSSLE
jgi:hypothetical protein